MFAKLFGKKYKHFDLDKLAFDSGELDHWRIVDAKTDDMRLILRLRIDKPDLQDIDEYQNCISITWNYAGVDDGLPDQQTKSQQDEFEDLLDELTMYNNLSFLLAISTGRQAKEWIFYCKDSEEFMTIFNDLLKRAPPYPLEVAVCQDQAWALWQEKMEIYELSAQDN